MKLTIIAASGGIGRQILSQAMAAGHDVTAVVRSPAKLGELAARVHVVNADLADPDLATLKSAVNGADAVLSALGPSTDADAGVATRGTRAMVVAMQAAGVGRIVAVSTAQASTTPTSARPNPPKHDPGDGLFTRQLVAPLVRSMLRQRLADLAEMEEVLRASDLNWTVVRPPRLTDKAFTGDYRTANGQNVRGGTAVARAHVAHLMLSVLSQPATFQQAIGIAD